MNYLICKIISRKKQNKYRKMLTTEKNIYDLPNFEGGVSFQPKYILEDGEWFVISNFKSKEYCIDLLREDFDSTKYELAYNANSEKIKYLCVYQNGDYFCFQRVLPSSIVRRSNIIGIGDNISIKSIDNGIVLSSMPDAIYVKSRDELFFRKLEAITCIFEGIQEIYREATNEEVKEFFSEDFISTPENYGIEKVGKANRRRLGWAIDILKNLDSVKRKELFTYIRSYNPQLHYENGVFKIENEDDMKNLVLGIDQRFYTTDVTKEIRRADSISNLKTDSEKENRS